MQCRKCKKIFPNVRFLYSCSDKVEGEWPECCGELTKFLPDWKPDIPSEDLSEAPNPPQDKNEEHRKRVLECCKEYDEIVPLDDGYRYFWVKDRGAMSAADLRIVADELDRQNEAWDKIVKSGT